MDSKEKELKAEVVVIGGGGSGLAAAVAAAEEGTCLIVLEKRGLGGNSVIAFGIFAAGVDTGGWVSETYFIKLSGFAFGYAVNSGRISGENAAGFALVK
jgi:glycine/D-amino acid oxidase-like deaminating enzyme